MQQAVESLAARAEIEEVLRAPHERSRAAAWSHALSAARSCIPTPASTFDDGSVVSCCIKLCSTPPSVAGQSLAASLQAIFCCSLPGCDVYKHVEEHASSKLYRFMSCCMWSSLLSSGVRASFLIAMSGSNCLVVLTMSSTRCSLTSWVLVGLFAGRAGPGTHVPLWDCCLWQSWPACLISFLSLPVVAMCHHCQGQPRLPSIPLMHSFVKQVHAAI